jgi:hypothetical protein
MSALNLVDGKPDNAFPLDEVIKLRNKLPDSWKWHKCYELPYFNSRTGREFSLKHWALTAPDGNGLVCSLGLISHDHHTENYKKFLENDAPVEWVEKSLLIVDSLLAEIEKKERIESEAKEVIQGLVDSFKNSAHSNRRTDAIQDAESLLAVFSR